VSKAQTGASADRAGGRDRRVALARDGREVYLTFVLLDAGRDMALARKATTTVSTKGQIILPKAVRDAKNWGAGKELIVEETKEGVLLRAARPFAPTDPEDVFGALSHHGKHLSDEDIEKALRAAAKRRHARD
jgi:AbrB family looped-hinge helix DNA binding protein